MPELYSIETKILKRAVRRNIERFPDDFMFEMTDEEFKNWRYHFDTSKSLKTGLRYKPMVFTEQGVANAVIDFAYTHPGMGFTSLFNKSGKT